MISNNPLLDSFVKTFLNEYFFNASGVSVESTLSSHFTCAGVGVEWSPSDPFAGSVLKAHLNYPGGQPKLEVLESGEQELDEAVTLLTIQLALSAMVRGTKHAPITVALSLVVRLEEHHYVLEHLHQSLIEDEDEHHRLTQLTIDKLTGLYSHWKFYEIIEDYLNQNRRYAVQAALIMVDVDHFTEINETIGTAEGDRILSEMALIIKKRLRTTDYVGRWDGQTFIALMPHTSYKDGFNTAESIRRMLSHTNFGMKRSLTVSIGISGIETIDSVEQWLDLTHRLMVEAKKQGRNKVVGVEHYHIDHSDNSKADNTKDQG